MKNKKGLLRNERCKGSADKGLRQLASFLQARVGRLTRRQLVLGLAAGILLSTTASTVVILQSLRSPGAGSWRVTPIKAFPLPPARPLPHFSPDTSGKNGDRLLEQPDSVPVPTRKP